MIKKDLIKFKNDIPEPDSVFYKLAVSQTFEAFKLPERVKLLHLNEVFEQDLDIWSEPPGLPWKDFGYKTKGDIRRDAQAIQKVRYFWYKVKRNEDIRPPHVTEHPEINSRAVWVFPATMTFGEAVYALPLIRAYKKQNNPIAYGFESENGFMELRDTFPDHTYMWYCRLNFSKFNKTVPAWLLEKAFLILLYNLDLVHYEGYGIPDTKRVHRMFLYIQDYFVNTPIRLANGQVWLKKSGIPNGSYFTQLIKSICNYILLKWFTYEAGIMVSKLMVFGEDSLMATTSRPDLEMLSDLAIRMGMKVNINRSVVSQNLNDFSWTNGNCPQY